MIHPLPREVADVLSRGVFCHVAARTSRGPHLTPVVYALSSSRLWLTTSRRAVKTRAWREDPRVGGMVRSGPLAVSFTGTVRMYDFLQPGTWLGSIVHSPTLTLAAIEFTRKNARFFAGYAVDAYQVPLTWTPPARVFVEVRIERAALLEHESGDVLGRWRMRKSPVVSMKTFRASGDGADPFAALPPEVAADLGDQKTGALSVDGSHGPAVIPVEWAAHRGGLYAAAPRPFLELAGIRGTVPVALTVDRASTWRASAMLGVLVQADAEIYDPGTLVSGGRSARVAISATGADPDRSILLRVHPSRLVWWQGWRSGTVAPDWPR